MRMWLWVAWAIVAGGVSGCDKDPGTNAPPPTSPTPALPFQILQITEAQPRLQTLKLWVGAEELIAELALNDRQRTAGMMFRTNMAENEAMLFVFPVPHRTSFWMQNTPLPLSAAYVGPDGAILEIHDLEPFNTNSVWASSSRVQYVLETRQGWFKQRNIGPGAVIRTERGTLQETFFKR